MRKLREGLRTVDGRCMLALLYCGVLLRHRDGLESIGYLLFTLERRFGWTAVFVMVVPYGMIHFHKPVLEALGALAAGTVLGALALRLRSFHGGVLLHGLVALTMDLLGARAAGLS